MPSVINSRYFLEKSKLINQNCSDEAYRTFLGYGYQWNVKEI